MDNLNNPNPFYIGFGSPNSKVLIIGQEKAIKESDYQQIKYESIENPNQWKEFIEENISDINFRFAKDYHFKNPLHPYEGKPIIGNTWNYYQKLMKK